MTAERHQSESVTVADDIRRRCRRHRDSTEGYVLPMAETITFPSNGSEASGYLVRPDGGRVQGCLVIQEWWGLDRASRRWPTRLAAAGFVALAPDLYHGELAAHDEMDKAGAADAVDAARSRRRAT